MITPVGIKSLDQSVIDEKAQEASIVNPFSSVENFKGAASAAWNAATWFDEFEEYQDERSQGFEEDPNWKMSQFAADKVNKDFGSLELDYLTKSTSEREFKWRLGNVKRHREDANSLAKYGNYGVAMTVAAGFIDPAGWAAGAATGGIGKLAQIGRAGRMAIGAAAGGAAGYGTGKFEQNYNSTVTDTDVIINAVMWGTVDGLAAGFGKSARAKMVDDDLAEAAGEAGTRMKGGKTNQPKMTDVEAFRENLQAKVNSDIEVEHVQNNAAQAKVEVDTLRQAEADKVYKGPKASDKKKVNSYLRKVEQILKKPDLSDNKLAAALKKANAKSPVKLTPAQARAYVKTLDEAKLKAKQAEDYATQAASQKTAKQELDEFDSLTPEQQAQKVAEWKSVGAARTGDLGDVPEYIDDDVIPMTGSERGLGRDMTEAQYESFQRGIGESENVGLKDIPVINKMGGLTDMLQSLYTTMSSSSNEVFRGMGRKLFANPQGAKQGGYVADSNVAITATNAKRRIMTAGGGAYIRNKSFEKFVGANRFVCLLERLQS